MFRLLLEGEELSEEFQEKARTIFEAAIKTKVSEIKENLETAYQQALVEELETIKEGLTERVDLTLSMLQTSGFKRMHFKSSMVSKLR